MNYIVTRIIVTRVQEDVLVEVPGDVDTPELQEIAIGSAEDFLADPECTDYDEGVVILDATEQYNLEEPDINYIATAAPDVTGFC